MVAFITILWTVIGFLGAGFIGTELGPLFGHRHQEGMSAYFGLFVASPIGAIAGGIFGYAMSQKFSDEIKRKRFMLGSLAIIVGVPFAVFVVESIRTRDHISPAKWLSCNARLPAGAAVPDKSRHVMFELRSDKETRQSSEYSEPNWEIKEGRPTVYGSVEVYRATPNRSVAVRIGEGPTYLFRLSTPALPKTYSYESEWLWPISTDGVAGVGQSEMEIKCGM